MVTLCVGETTNDSSRHSQKVVSPFTLRPCHSGVDVLRTAGIRITTLTVLLAMTNVVANAGCKCQSGGTTPHVVSEPGIPMAVNVEIPCEVDQGAVHAPHPLQADGRRYPLSSSSGGIEFGRSAAWDRNLTPLVPGTVGQTYSRTSHAIPTEKHPRIAMVAVRDHGRVANMSVNGMSGFRMSNGVWLFETDRPLVPGKENIVRVEARKDTHDIQPQEFRFVRLLPGRLVYLDFYGETR